MTQFGTWQPKIRGKLFYNWPQGACEEALRFTSAGQLGVEPYDMAIVGAGVVGATHLHAEATLVASPGPLAPASQIVPYGAIRLQDLTASDKWPTDLRAAAFLSQYSRK